MKTAIAFLVALWAAATPSPAQQDPSGTPDQGMVTNRRLAAWFEEMEKLFADEEAIAQGKEWLEASLAFHDHAGFLEEGGVELESQYQEYRFKANGGRIKQVRGFGRLFLMPGFKGAYEALPPTRMRGEGRISARLVHDGEKSWIHADGRDNHQAEAALRAWNRVQRERILCGLPFALADPGVQVAALGESRVYVLGEDGREVARKTWRIRVKLPKDVALGLWTFGEDEPVSFLHAEFYQDNFQLAALDYYMFRSGRMNFDAPWFLYRHEFSAEFVEERFHTPALRLTDLEADGSRGREHRTVAVEAGPAPEEHFNRGWEILESLPVPGTGPDDKQPPR